MLVLSGALVPLGGLPSWLQAIAKFDIFAYPVDALRRLMLGTDSSAASKVQLTGLQVLGHRLSVGDELVFSGACTLLFVLVAVWRFARSN
jgi:ABC-2 type transport system permease protein